MYNVNHINYATCELNANLFVEQIKHTENVYRRD